MLTVSRSWWCQEMWTRVTTILICLLGAPAAQAAYFSLSARCTGTEVVLRIHGYRDSGEDVAGLHIYRRPIAIECAPPQRVTVEPVAVPVGVVFTQEVPDASIRSNLTYAYWLVSVNAEGRETGAGISGDWAGCGMGPIAYGVIEDTSWTLVVRPTCEISCNDSDLIVEYPEGLTQFINKNVPLLLYGEIHNHAIDGPLMVVTDWQIMPCTTAVATTLWGEVKGLYR